VGVTEAGSRLGFPTFEHCPALSASDERSGVGKEKLGKSYVR